nr:immunoglobulin light chain junction region [Macaca mulatta]MPO03714.1 immunoglobulin light chain junction region [Macaca mulatta]MPO03908.1 immunoglobulin light chain junction region [Macaca mulatta]MPO06050.1 immunoglobulin light chain junction region [Macaca mulatta]MPO07468.1 immunoglobulin light chain junction region [Macaca mulatta]
GSSYAGSNVLF